MFRETTYHLFILFFLSSVSLLKAQDTLYTQADQMPYFKGCEKMAEGTVEKRNCSNQALISYIATNLEVPKSDITGVVYVTFFISEEGKVENTTVLRGLEKPQDEAALKVVRNIPVWEPARLNGQPIRVKMTLPLRFTEKNDAEFANGFQITWGNLKGTKATKDELLKNLNVPIIVRDEMGNLLDVNELMLEKERNGKFTDAHSNGVINDDMKKIVKKLKAGDTFTLTVTVQKRGQFFYADKSYVVD
jgi:TonB family protein